ncbi:MAG: hypothetical protein WEB33_04770, partial [Bacteroidota bacterium]
RSGIFFAEKRPFFLEGNEIFNIAGAGVFAPDPVLAGVHTRTIENPLLGLKLSGKIGKRSTLASIYALDEPTGASEPKSHVPIVRFKQALSGDDSYLGALYTGREVQGTYNRVLGTDGSLRTSQSDVIDYNVFTSDTKSTDSTDAVTGHSVALGFNSGTRDLQYGLGFNKVSTDFNTQTGFLLRTGILAFSGYVTPKFYPESGAIRRIDVTLYSSQIRDDFSKLWETFNFLRFQAVLPGGLSFSVRGKYSSEIFAGQRFRTDGLLVSGGGQFTREVNLSLSYDYSKSIYYPAPYQGVQSLLSATLTYQPWNQFEARLSLTHVSFTRDSDDLKIYEYPIGRARLTYQLNKYLFFRGILEYNKLRRTMLTDFLASFTYIPGTVIHAGYGSLYQRQEWQTNAYVNVDPFSEFRRGFFMKMSYLWRS